MLSGTGTLACAPSLRLNRDACRLKKLRDVLPHLMLPIRPIMPTLRPPIVQVMMDPLALKDMRKPIRRPAVLPRPTAGGDVDIALVQLPNLVIVGVRKIIHRIV